MSAPPQAVRVCCRVRPALPSESTRCCTEITSFNGMRMIQLNDPRNTRESITYQFDEVFTAASTQEDVYRREGTLAAERIMSGFPATILAYGTAGSGKTHTLYGQRENPGVGPQCVAALLKMAQETQLADDSGPILQVSYYELYQNQVFDLLAGKNHEVLLGDVDLAMTSDAFTKVGINHIDDLWTLILRVREDRAEQRKEATANNERAIRSHSLMNVYVSRRCSSQVPADNSSPAAGARLTLVDLAGNDDSRKGGAPHLAREPTSVQHALMSLGRAVAALQLKTGPVPFHESKLTQLLSEVLMEGSLTTLMTCIAPHPKYYHDTSSSLDFAAQARGQAQCSGNAPVKYIEPAARAQRPGGLADPPKRGGGGGNRSSFAAMMAPPCLIHPAHVPLGAMQGLPVPHWMTGRQHEDGYQEHMAEAVAGMSAAGSGVAPPSTDAKATSSQPGPGAAGKKRKADPVGSYYGGAPATSKSLGKTSAKAAKYTVQPVPSWSERAGDEQQQQPAFAFGEAPRHSYDRNGAKVPQELSMADTPCRREVSTPLRSLAPEMPTSLLKSSSHHNTFSAEVSSLWGPMTPIASNADFSHLTSSCAKDSSLRLNIDLLGCTPRSGGNMLLDFDRASGDAGPSSAAHSRGAGQASSRRRDPCSAQRRASTDLISLDESSAINTSDLMLTPLRDLDVDLRFNSRSPNAGHGHSPYCLLPDTPAGTLSRLTGAAGSKASPSDYGGCSRPSAAAPAHASPGLTEVSGLAPPSACSFSHDAPPPPLQEALEMVGGVHGAAHRKLLDMLNHADVSRLCSLKGIGKQRARKLVETRQLHPYGPVFTHVDQLASVAGMTLRQIDKFFVDNLEIPLPR